MIGGREKASSKKDFAGLTLRKGLPGAASEPENGPGARAAEVVSYGPDLHDPWLRNMRGSSFGNEIPNGCAVPLPVRAGAGALLG